MLQAKQCLRLRQTGSTPILRLCKLSDSIHVKLTAPMPISRSKLSLANCAPLTGAFYRRVPILKRLKTGLKLPVTSSRKSIFAAQA